MARAPRNRTLIIVKCQRQDGEKVSIKVRNASATGLLGECADVADFAVGEQVRLTFRTLAPVTAQVVWREQGFIGITFGQEIDIERLVRAHSHSSTALPEQSPRSETMVDWIERTRREREYVQAQRAASGARLV